MRGFGEIVGVANGADALQNIERTKPDVIVLDMHLPDISGYEIIGRLKAHAATNDIPIVILTGYAVDEERLLSSRDGDIPILTKPFDNDHLVAAIEEKLKLS